MKVCCGIGGRVVDVRLSPDAAQEYVVQMANETTTTAKRQAIADERPQNRDDGHHREALHHGAQHILFSNQAPIKQRQARAGHHQHESRTS